MEIHNAIGIIALIHFCSYMQLVLGLSEALPGARSNYIPQYDAG